MAKRRREASRLLWRLLHRKTTGNRLLSIPPKSEKGELRGCSPHSRMEWRLHRCYKNAAANRDGEVGGAEADGDERARRKECPDPRGILDSRVGGAQNCRRCGVG